MLRPDPRVRLGADQLSRATIAGRNSHDDEGDDADPDHQHIAGDEQVTAAAVWIDEQVRIPVDDRSAGQRLDDVPDGRVAVVSSIRARLRRADSRRVRGSGRALVSLGPSGSSRARGVREIGRKAQPTRSRPPDRSSLPLPPAVTEASVESRIDIHSVSRRPVSALYMWRAVPIAGGGYVDAGTRSKTASTPRYLAQIDGRLCRASSRRGGHALYARLSRRNQGNLAANVRHTDRVASDARIRARSDGDANPSSG